MKEKQIHRLLVSDSERRLVGLISLNDIAREAETKKARQISDGGIAGVLAAVSAPRHRIIQARAA